MIHAIRDRCSNTWPRFDLNIPDVCLVCKSLCLTMLFNDVVYDDEDGSQTNVSTLSDSASSSTIKIAEIRPLLLNANRKIVPNCINCNESDAFLRNVERPEEFYCDHCNGLYRVCFPAILRSLIATHNDAQDININDKRAIEKFVETCTLNVPLESVKNIRKHYEKSVEDSGELVSKFLHGGDTILKRGRKKKEIVYKQGWGKPKFTGYVFTITIVKFDLKTSQAAALQLYEYKDGKSYYYPLCDYDENIVRNVCKKRFLQVSFTYAFFFKLSIFPFELRSLNRSSSASVRFSAPLLFENAILDHFLHRCSI